MNRNDVNARCACFSAGDLAALAELRRETGLRVVHDGPRIWVAWEGDVAGIVDRVLSLPASQLYERRAALWFRVGCRLPSFDLPVERDEGVPLCQALLPAPALPTGSTMHPVVPMRLSLVAEERSRPTTALRCPLDVLARWAERATSAQLDAVRAAQSGDECFLTGRALPPITAGARYWGVDVFVPLGVRPEPALGEAGLRRALGIAPGEWLVLAADGYEAIPRAAFRPLTRAGVRLACQREDGTA